MNKIKAINLERGMIIKEGKNYFEVIDIEEVTEKAIHFRVTRIYPDVYGDFKLYKKLSTKVDIVDPKKFDMRSIRKDPNYLRN